jgi:hypothetical protein
MVEMSIPRRLIPGWARPDHPVYRLERSRQSRNLPLRALHEGCLPATLAGTGLAATVVYVLLFLPQIQWGLETGVVAMLIGFAVLLVLIQVLAGAGVNVLAIAQTAPLISGEIELQSWRVLRSTTLGLREILMAKLAAALAQLRHPLTGLLTLRLASAITIWVYIGFSLLRQSGFYYDPDLLQRWLQNWNWFPPVAAAVIFSAWYLTQPVLQLMLCGGLGLAASATTRSRSAAAAAALVSRLVLWVASIVLNVGAIYALVFIIVTNWMTPTYAPLRFFRELPAPSPQEAGLVISLTIIVYTLTVFALQVGVIAAAFHTARRRAAALNG